MFPYDTQPAYPQLQDQLAKIMMPQNQNAPVHVAKVNGRAGAESYILPPNSDAILLDMNEAIAWFIQSDGAGYRTVTPYDISLHKEVSQKDVIKSMEDRITKLEEAIKNVKPNTSANYSKPARSEQQRNDASNRSNA